MTAEDSIAPLVDSHCHLTHRCFGDEIESTIVRAKAAGVIRCVTIGTGVDDAIRARELTRRHPDLIAATAGLDPFSAHAAGERFDDELARLAELVRAGGFVGIGEIGLDYHYDLDPKPVQAQRFERQLQLASELGLPVVIHVREAHDDLAAILAAHPRSRGVVHSFTAGPAEAERYLALGWLLAFNGVITFKNAAEVRDAARLTPADKLLVETDSPFLAPAPHRGERCEPAHVALTIARLAEVRNQESRALASVTTSNARRLFAI